MSQRWVRTATCVAATTLLAAGPARAVIVFEGREVPAWPDAAARRASGSAAHAVAATGYYPQPKGEVFGLTLLVDFGDAEPAFTTAEIDAWLNERGYSAGGLNGSVRDYYFDQSNGLVDFQNELFGFYRAQHPKSHYEASSGYQGASELVAEMLEYFDGQVDFSKYDNDGDGRTDALSIVYAGEAETWGQGLWPHAGSTNERRDGVTIARYMMTNLGTSLGLYTFSHEVGHMLFGWPDLYGFGNYCIMGNASSARNPVGINDFYRADQGWIEAVDVKADTNALYTAKVNGVGYRYVNPDRPEELFFWSNVQSDGRFSTIEGDGILLLHFDEAIGRNDPPALLSLAVVQADGKKELDQTMWPEPGSDAADFFHAGGVSEFSAPSFASASWNDESASGLRIYDISAAGPEMTFKVGTGAIIEPIGGSSAGGSGGTAAAMEGGAAGSSPVGAGMGGAIMAGGAGPISGSHSGSSALAGTSGGLPPSGNPYPSSPSSSDDGCGCRLSSDKPEPLYLLGLASVGLALGRRRRARSRSANR
jgi:M6 family metalloprotease-like protein/MYXO-CTERM domain-containing protein